MTPPPPFPQVVCWREDVLGKVINHAALGVDDAVFRATHFPAPIRRLNLATPESAGASYSEKELLVDFLKPGSERLFCVAVGDPGTGKSHLVRWLSEQTKGREKATLHIVVVPRHAANLAQVLRCILADDFRGDAVERIRREIQRTSDLSPYGAQTRVLDELAFVLEPANRTDAKLEFKDDSDHQEILLPLLPAFLRDHDIRGCFTQAIKGHVISRIATHVMGTRSDRADAPPSLLWGADDLIIPSQVSKRAGSSAKELATAFATDARLRELGAEVLNRALQEAWPRLLGLQKGNLGVAMLEIRRQLKKQGKELLLFIEDMSVSQGMDAELIEALIVKPSEESTPICAMRSIIGVTKDDFRSLRENILGRIDLAVGFDRPVGEDERNAVTENQLIDFASRYLNAARFSLKELETWAKKADEGEEAPSFCEASGCPNRAECWRTFGVVEGRGLYPFNRAALLRLYHQQLRGEDQSAFNPRVLVKDVIGQVLQHGARQIPLGSYPGNDLLEWFRLQGVGADAQLRLQRTYGVNGPRARALIEIYAKNPFGGALSDDVAVKFGLNGSGPKEAETLPVAPAASSPRLAPAEPVSQQDEFDRWLNKEKPNDSDINRWRGLVYSAIIGSQDWDSHELSGWVKRLLQRRWIHFEGQAGQETGDVRIKIRRTAESALALRALRKQDRRPDSLLVVMAEVEGWTEELVTAIKRNTKVAGAPKPLEAAVHALAVAGLATGRVDPAAPLAEFMKQVLAEWPDPAPSSTKGGTLGRLQDASFRNAPALREWLLDQAGTLKGESAKAIFLNTADVIAFFESARRRVNMKFDPDVTAKWDPNSYEDVLNLVDVINQNGEKALEQTGAASTKLVERIDDFRGDTKLSELGILLRDAVKQAVDVTALDDSRVVQYQAMMEDLAHGRLDPHYDRAKRLAVDAPRNQGLALAAELDQSALDRLVEMLDGMQATLKKADTYLDQVLAKAGLDDLEKLEKETRQSLGQLRADLETLIADPTNE